VQIMKLLLEMLARGEEAWGRRHKRGSEHKRLARELR
jgi:hypothetical protein